MPRLRRRRGHPVHPRQLAARMGHDPGGPAAAGNPCRAPTRSASARSACRRNSAASSSSPARRCRPSRSSPRKSRAAIPACPTSWCRTGRSRCCCATSRRATCRRSGSSASSRTRSSCSPIASTEPRGASDRWLPYNVPEAAMQTRAVKQNGELDHQRPQAVHLQRLRRRSLRGLRQHQSEGRHAAGHVVSSWCRATRPGSPSRAATRRWAAGS